MKYFLVALATLVLMLAATPSKAQRPAHQPYYSCEEHTPYYTRGNYGPGQGLMVVFLPMMVAIGVPASAADPTALCAPLAVLGSRPPHAEHWQPE